MKKYQFDEMQMKKRNEIASQTLNLIVILLMLDILSYNLGFTWIDYPTNIFSIVILSSGTYLIRCALTGTLIAPKQNLSKSTTNTIVTMAISMIVITLLIKFIDHKPTNNSNGSGSEMLTIISVISYVFILATAIIYFIKRYKDNKLND